MAWAKGGYAGEAVRGAVRVRYRQGSGGVGGDVRTRSVALCAMCGTCQLVRGARRQTGLHGGRLAREIVAGHDGAAAGVEHVAIRCRALGNVCSMTHKL